MNKSHGGRVAQRGIYAQNWAAMSLFLQFVQQKDFLYIGFEGEKLEDFHLVFSDGRKMVCESKNQILNYSDIKTILEKIAKHGQINKNDQIVIICKSVNSSAKSDIENYKYFKDRIDTVLSSRPHNFGLHHLKLLPQVRFWEVPQNMNEFIVKALLTRMLGVWVPEKRLDEVKDHIVLKEVFHGSAEGKTLTKDDFIKKLEDKKIEILEYAGYERNRQTAEKDVQEILQLVEKQNNTKIVPHKVSDLSRKPSEFYYLITKLGDKKDLDLAHWNQIWNAAVSTFLSLHIFKIFVNNIARENNQKYALSFIEQILSGGYDFFREEFIKKDIADLCKLIYEKNNKFERRVFEIVKKLFEPSITDFFYREKPLGRKDDRWEREEISKLIRDLYRDTKDAKLKKQVIVYLSNTFNLVEDNGEYWHYTPSEIFEIFREDILSAKELSKKIIWFKDLCVAHYNSFYSRFRLKGKFDGWELMGSGISQSGRDFSIGDNHFVYLVLKPALKGLYEDKNKGWDFIINHCISRKIEDISSNNPDFLNRASLPILFEEYKSGKHSKEALAILSDFIRMRKGIPWKADLIFQELRGDYSDEQKWALVKVSLDEYNNLPVNVFVEQIVSDLAKIEHKKALATIAQWVKNPEYNRRQTMGSFNVMENISKLLDNPKTFSEGVPIYKNYITSDDFIKKDNDWETWDVAKVLAKIVTIKPEVGIGILKEVSGSKILTQNQQTLLCSSINDLAKDDRKVLERVYQDFVLPFLQSLDSDITKIENRITNRYSREQLVQFAEKLAESGLWSESLYIVEIFVNDSDPILKNYPDDEKGDFNEHEKVKAGEDSFTIRTVRGWCAWVLQKLVMPRNFARINETRSIIERALPLLEKLATDQNYYVRVQVSAPLTALAKNRNTVLPENRKERFVSPEIADKIGDLAFLMLRDSENHKLPAVMKHLAMVFTYMRSLTKKEAWEVLQTFLKDEYPKKNKQRGYESYLADILNEAAPLYIFFAEFRSKAFKDWPKGWGNLGAFDPKPFKKLLESLLKSEDSDIRRVFTWQIARLPNEVKDRPEFSSILKLAADYLMLATDKYDHNVFGNIYRFVEDYIDNDEYFEFCFDLWKACIKTEAKFFKDNFSKDKLQEMYWWPFFYNGKILLRIAGQKGNGEFLKWFKVLADYPAELYLANDLDVAVEHLITIKTNKEAVESLLDKLMERNSKYYECKQRWVSSSQTVNEHEEQTDKNGHI